MASDVSDKNKDVSLLRRPFVPQSLRFKGIFYRLLASSPDTKVGEAPVPLIKGHWSSLPPNVLEWTAEQIHLCQPDSLYIMDGSYSEDKALKAGLVKKGVLIPLPKYDNCFLARTDPKDVARVESRTVISTANKEETIPEPAEVRKTESEKD